MVVEAFTRAVGCLWWLFFLPFLNTGCLKSACVHLELILTILSTAFSTFTSEVRQPHEFLTGRTKHETFKMKQIHKFQGKMTRPTYVVMVRDPFWEIRTVGLFGVFCLSTLINLIRQCNKLMHNLIS